VSGATSRLRLGNRGPYILRDDTIISRLGVFGESNTETAR